MRRIWLLALAAALLTTACRIETNILIDLADDGSGSFGVEFGTDEEFRQLMEADGGELDFSDLSGALGTDVPGATVTQRTEGDMEFTTATFDFSNQAELQQVISEGAGEGGDISVVYTDDTVTVNATLEGTGGLGDLAGDAAGDLGGDSGGDFDLDFGSLTSGFADSFFSGSVIVAMPGEVQSHNASRVLPDGRLQWDLSLDGGDIEIMAVSDLGGGSSFPAWALALLVLVALAIVMWLISVSRKRATSVAAVAAAGSGDEPPAPPDGWGDTGGSDEGAPETDEAP